MKIYGKRMVSSPQKRVAPQVLIENLKKQTKEVQRKNNYLVTCLEAFDVNHKKY